MKILKPWDYKGGYDFTLFYGNDLALSLSLSRMDGSSYFVEFEELMANKDILYLSLIHI